MPGVDIPTDLSVFGKLLEKSMTEVQLDLEFLVQQMEILNKADGFLKGKFNLENLVVAGHSMGGMASAIFCNKKAN